MTAKKKDEVSRETYRAAFHKVQEELLQLRASLAKDASSEDALWEDLEATVGDSSGYYRFGRSRNGHYWARFKWTEGPHMGRYAIGGHTTLIKALWACQADVQAILSGKKTAPLDVGYKGKVK